jgi:hypothetical protein
MMTIIDGSRELTASGRVEGMVKLERKKTGIGVERDLLERENLA